MSGSALKGYLDGSSGLFIKIDWAFPGRVVADGVCRTHPQWQLYLRVTFRNTLRQKLTYTALGLTVKDTAGTVYEPFGWGPSPPAPSHSGDLAAGKNRTGSIYYFVRKPTSFGVWWRFMPSARPGTSVMIARFRVERSGVKDPCSAE